MIFFMIKGPEEQESYTIPLYSEEEITAGNIQLISWNEACYTKPDGSVVQFQNLNKLKETVFLVAESDSLCININHQFMTQYGIDIFAAYADPAHVFHPVIDHVFEFWAHPMIGNILVSSGMRPQTTEDQFLHNWWAFPKRYMNPETKRRINVMMTNLSSVGLEDLTKSSRDQVRICRDMTELARAVMGEISTWATKKLEKIYALELCSSPVLFQVQKQLIKAILTKIQLKDIFNFLQTEYIYFYLPTLEKLDKEMQWSAFVLLLEDTIKEKSGLPYVVPTDLNDRQTIGAACDQFHKIPPTMRCAMFINYIRKAGGSVAVNRYSLTVPQNFDFAANQDFLIPCTVREAAGKNFIPELVITLKKRALLWSWNRNEKHIATMTYRHYLMPLWAGPVRQAIRPV